MRRGRGWQVRRSGRWRMRSIAFARPSMPPGFRHAAAWRRFGRAPSRSRSGMGRATGPDPHATSLAARVVVLARVCADGAGAAPACLLCERSRRREHAACRYPDPESVWVDACRTGSPRLAHSPIRDHAGAGLDGGRCTCGADGSHLHPERSGLLAWHEWRGVSDHDGAIDRAD